MKPTILFLFLSFSSIAQDYKEISYNAENILVMNGVCTDAKRRVYFNRELKVNLISVDECRDNGVRRAFLRVSANNQEYITSWEDVHFNLDSREIKRYFNTLKSDNQLAAYEKFARSISSIYMDSIKKDEENKALIKFEADEKIRLEREEKEKEIKIENDREHRAKLDRFYLERMVSDSIILDSTEKLMILIESLSADLKSKYVSLASENGNILVNTFSTRTNFSTDVTLGLVNLSIKRIKYATFNLQAFNSVDDKIGGLESVKGIGFVEPNESSTWEFESVWFEDYIDYVRIISILLEYEDGSTYRVINPSKILIHKQELDVLAGGKIFEYRLIGALSVRTNDSYSNIGVIVKMLDMNNELQGLLIFYDELESFINTLDYAIKVIIEGTNEFKSEHIKVERYSTIAEISSETGITYLSYSQLIQFKEELIARLTAHRKFSNE